MARCDNSGFSFGFCMATMERLPSLNAIRYFEAAARHGSFTLAADELSVTQSAVSRMVQQLEDELGVQLFTRAGRVIALTPAGGAYQREVSQALKQIRMASAAVRKTSEATALSVIASSGFATRWLVPRQPDLRRRHATLRVVLLANEAEASNDGSRPWVRIRYGSGSWPGYVAHPLPVPRTLGVVCSAAFKADEKLVAPADLYRVNLLSYTGDGHSLWQEYFDHFGLPAPDLGAAMRFHQLPMLIEAAVSGMGCALLPLFLLRPELEAGRLVEAVPGSFEPGRSYYLVHSKGGEKDRAVRLFKQWLLRA